MIHYEEESKMKNEFICDCNTIHQDVVDKVAKKMLDQSLIFQIANFYKILGDSTRMKILYALDKSEMCVCDIANLLSMSKSSISHQLSILRKNGFVKYRKNGKEVYYTLDDDHVKTVIEIGIEHVEHKENEYKYNSYINLGE